MSEAERYKLERYWNQNNKNENKVLELERLDFHTIYAEFFYKNQEVVLLDVVPYVDGQMAVKTIINNCPEWAVSRLTLYYEISKSEKQNIEKSASITYYVSDHLRTWFNNALVFYTDLDLEFDDLSPVYVTSKIVYNHNRSIYEFSDNKV